jgi:hypothetical protein
MTNQTPDNSRRRFIKLTAIGLAAAPFANTLLSGIAGAADMVTEADPQASALGYKADAAKAEKLMHDHILCGREALARMEAKTTSPA